MIKILFNLGMLENPQFDKGNLQKTWKIYRKFTDKNET